MILIDPSDFVDREAEARRFETLLAFATQRRILAVSDKTGWGKTTFLRKLRHMCDYQSIPVALVLLDELPYLDEFTLVREAANQLRRTGVLLRAFHTLDHARALHDVGAFTDIYRPLRGTIDAGGASVSGGQVAGSIFNIENAGSVGLPDWTDEVEQLAKLVCLDAFLSDLFETSRRHPIVIIVDAVELADEELRRWLFLTFVKNRLLANPDGDHKLVAVLAGENLEEVLKSQFNAYDAYFECIHALGSWELHDTARMLEVHQLGGLLQHQVESLHNSIISREVSLAGALAIAAIYKTGLTQR